MLSYFLWSSRLGARYQWALVIGTYFGSRTLSQMAANSSGPKLLWWIVLGTFYGFIYLTWTAQPMFNLFLRMDRFGRYVLSPDQHVASNWFGGLFLGALVALAWFIADDTTVSFYTMFFLAVLSVCVAAVFSRRGKHRVTLAVATGVLALFAALSMIPLGAGGIPNGFALFFIYGFLGFQVLANLIAIHRT
jgi:hypothetical protein